MLVDLNLNFANRRSKTKVLKCGGGGGAAGHGEVSRWTEEHGTEQCTDCRGWGPCRSVLQALTKLSGLGEP